MAQVLHVPDAGAAGEDEDDDPEERAPPALRLLHVGDALQGRDARERVQDSPRRFPRPDWCSSHVQRRVAKLQKSVPVQLQRLKYPKRMGHIGQFRFEGRWNRTITWLILGSLLDL